MRIGIDIDLGFDRIRARHRRDGTVLFDDEALIAIGPPDPRKPSLVASLEERLGKGDRRPQLVGIGAPSGWIGPVDKVLPVVSRDDFQPGYAAAVAYFMTMMSWQALRGGWLTALPRFFDRVDASIAIEGHEQMSPDVHREFVKYLYYSPQIHWLVGGKKVTYSAAGDKFSELIDRMRNRLARR